METIEEKAKRIAQSMYRRGLKSWYVTEELKHHGDIDFMEKSTLVRLVEDELKKLENY